MSRDTLNREGACDLSESVCLSQTPSGCDKIEGRAHRHTWSCARSTSQDVNYWSLRPPSPPTHLAPVPPPPRLLSRPPFSPAAPTSRHDISSAMRARRTAGWRAWRVHVACTPRRWRRAHFAPVLWKSQVSDEAAERVVREELLALELDARRGRGVVGLEPLLDGAALVRMR